MTMPIPQLDPPQSAALLPYPALVDALRAAVSEAADGRIACPPRQTIALPGAGQLLSMAAVASDIAVHKLIAVVPANATRGLPTIGGRLSVLDAASGQALLNLDGGSVTARRTAALSMLGVDILLARAPRHALIVGTGMQALHHAQALAAVYPGTPIGVAGRDRAAAVRFCETHRATLADLAPANVASMAPDTDLVIACTTSRQPVYYLPALAGRLLIAVGSFHADAAEIGAATVLASRIVVDDPAGAAHEAGDLLMAGVDMARVSPLAAMLSGERGLAQREAYLFKTVGCAAWDLAAARVALARQCSSSDLS